MEVQDGKAPAADAGNKAQAPAADAGKGAAAPSDDVQRLINSAVANARREWKADVDARLTPLQEKAALAESMQTEFASIKEFIEQLQGGEEDGGDESRGDLLDELEQQLTPPKWIKTAEAKQTWLALRRAEIRQNAREAAFADELSNLRAEAETSKAEREALKKERENERTAKLEVERESKIQGICLALKEDVVDPELLYEWVERRTTRTDKGKLVLRVGEDEDPLPLTAENVQRVMKASLRRSAAGEGGSGAGGGKQHQSAAANVSALKLELEDVDQKLRKSPGDDSLVSRAMGLRRKLRAAEQQAA